jgi:integrase
MRIHLWNLLHKLFQDAIEELEIIDVNPVRKSLRPDVPKVERRFLKPAEAFRFLDFVRDDHIGPAIWIMTLTALRIGETQALNWGDVDFDSGWIFIRRQWSAKEKKIKEVKNKKSLRVPMLPELSAYLKGKKPVGAPDMAYVAPNRQGGMIYYKTVEHGLRRLCKAFKIDYLSPHECRHTCTEIWYERGATKEDIRRLLNHSSDASTTPYIHRTDERLERLAGFGIRAIQ